jgi:hypothetical protein
MANDKPPQPSHLVTPTSHHTSPYPGNEQTPLIETPPASTKRAKISRMPEVPMHKTKHSEPVGRPKNRNYD